MLKLIIFILACYGATMITVYGKIFDKIRPKKGFLGDLFKCTMCTGFWIGIFISIILKTDFNFFIAALISSGTSYILSNIFDDEGIAIKNK